MASSWHGRYTPLNTLVTLVVVNVLLALLIGDAQSQIRTYSRLVDSGVVWTAVVSDQQPFGHRHEATTYKDYYDYQVGATVYHGVAEIAREDHDRLVQGARIAITYLPTDPSVSSYRPAAQIAALRPTQLLQGVVLVLLTVYMWFVIRDGRTNGWSN